MLRPGDIPSLRKRYNSPVMADVKARLLEQAHATDDGHLPKGRPENVWLDPRRLAFEARALLYLVEGDEAAGRSALHMALDYLSSMVTDFKAEDDYFLSLGIHRAIFGAAMVYDWCYPLLTPEQKRDFITQVKRVAERSEGGWPPMDVKYVTGHVVEMKPVAMLAAGIAFYDEDTAIYDLVANHLYNGLTPARNFFYPGHKHSQGSAYGPARFDYEVTTSFIVTRMGLENPCVPDQGKVPYYFLYSRRPDGLFIVEGDDYAGAGPGWYDGGDLLHMLSAMYADPYVEDEALRYASNVDDATLRMIVRDETRTAKPVSELPLTYYFPSPAGEMIARTGWDISGGKQAPAAIATMNIGEYLAGNHQHLDAGNFTVYYKGPLAIDSGIYIGTQGGYGCEHFRNYYQRTVAHNSLLILDPDEPTPLAWNQETRGWVPTARDGGEFWLAGRAEEPKTIQEVIAHGHRGRVLAHAFGPDPLAPDYSYIAGDITQAYLAPPPYPAKVSQVARSFVFLNLKSAQHPAALVVFDRITSTKPEFHKSWLLHSIDEPVVRDGAVSIEQTRDGYNGKLVNHTLWPPAENRQITTVGGPGREFWVDGRNYPQSYDRPYDHDPGAWRVEVSPKEPAATDLLLNIMQVMDARGGPEPLVPRLLDQGEMVGAAIADRVVFFGKTGARLVGPVSLQLPDTAGDWGCMVADLSPGHWSVEGPARFALEVTDEGACLYFRGPAGKYALTRTPQP
jgi:heparin/heparan-sulfate lyase